MSQGFNPKINNLLESNKGVRARERQAIERMGRSSWNFRISNLQRVKPSFLILRLMKFKKNSVLLCVFLYSRYFFCLNFKFVPVAMGFFIFFVSSILVSSFNSKGFSKTCTRQEFFSLSHSLLPNLFSSTRIELN